MSTGPSVIQLSPASAAFVDARTTSLGPWVSTDSNYGELEYCLPVLGAGGLFGLYSNGLANDGYFV